MDRKAGWPENRLCPKTTITFTYSQLRLPRRIGRTALAFISTRGYIARESIDTGTMPETRNTLVAQLVEYLRAEGVEIRGATGIEGMESPPLITNDGFGTSRPRRPDVIGFDPGKRRIVFGLVVPDRESLDSEDALEAYNVFLDHNAGAGERASALYVILPQELLNEFTSLVTHYIHREYWHRVVGVAATAGSPPAKRE